MSSPESDGGFDPHVGEISAVRTFRVGPGGVLYPLFSSTPWLDGDNLAVCKLTHRTSGPGEHQPPEPDCTCGFYAFANLAAAGEYPFAEHVLAVVTCWGHVIVGTKGLRAQHARIEAIWLSDTVPADLAQLTAARYPGVARYTDRDAMLAAYAPTILSDYELDTITPTSLQRWGTRATVAAAVVAGVLPFKVISGVSYGLVSWFVLLAILLAVGIAPRGHRPDAAVHRRRLISLALVLWMCAPFVGSAGLFFFRLPLLQLTVLMRVHRKALGKMARTFPARIA